jgi:hypothetical protein
MFVCVNVVQLADPLTRSSSAVLNVQKFAFSNADRDMSAVCSSARVVFAKVTASIQLHGELDNMSSSIHNDISIEDLNALQSRMGDAANALSKNVGDIITEIASIVKTCDKITVADFIADQFRVLKSGLIDIRLVLYVLKFNRRDAPATRVPSTATSSSSSPPTKVRMAD